MTCAETRLLLNARFDNEVGSAEAGEIDGHLRTCPECAERLESMQHVRDELRDALLSRPAPAHLRDNVVLAIRGARRFDGPLPVMHWKTWAAIAAGLALVSLAGLYLLRGLHSGGEMVAEELISAHQRALLGSGIDVVSSDRHTVKPWFDGKISFSPPVADLAAEGFPLKGGRLDYAGGHAIATLVYARRLHRIDVFVWPIGAGGTPDRRYERNGYNEIAWSRGGFNMVAVSDLNGDELKAFTRLLNP